MKMFLFLAHVIQVESIKEIMPVLRREVGDENLKRTSIFWDLDETLVHNTQKKNDPNTTAFRIVEEFIRKPKVKNLAFRSHSHDSFFIDLKATRNLLKTLDQKGARQQLLTFNGYINKKSPWRFSTQEVKKFLKNMLPNGHLKVANMEAQNNQQPKQDDEKKAKYILNNLENSRYVVLIDDQKRFLDPLVKLSKKIPNLKVIAIQIKNHS